VVEHRGQARDIEQFDVRVSHDDDPGRFVRLPPLVGGLQGSSLQPSAGLRTRALSSNGMAS
jgi:hypothetical protein